MTNVLFIIVSVTAASDIVNVCCQTLYDQHYQMVEFALKVTIVIFITEIIIAPVKIFTEAAASVASTVATALTVVAHAKISRKIENSTPCKIVTHEDFNLKLGTRDYVAEATHHTTLGSNRPSGGFPPNRRNITPV